MIDEPIKITNLETLQREKQRLKMFCSYQEQSFKDKIQYAKHNYKQLIWEEFLPYGDEQNQKISNVLDWTNEFVFGKFLRMDLEGKNKISGSLIKLGQVGLIRLFNSVFKK